MKTSVLEVQDMLSVLSVDGVEKRIGLVPGVESVTVNYDAGSATVRYDETRLQIADIKSAVRQLGYEPDAPHASRDDAHAAHNVKVAPPAMSEKAPPAATRASAESKTPPVVPTSTTAAAATAAPKSAPTAVPAAPTSVVPAVAEPQEKTASQKN